MELFISALTSSLTPHVVFSMLGGFLGSMISSDKSRYGWQLSLLFMVASIAFAAAVGEYLHYQRGISSLWWLFVMNIPLGMFVGATLDVIRITSPPLIEKMIVSIGNSGINLVVESVLNKLSAILGVKPPTSKASILEDAERKKEEEK